MNAAQLEIAFREAGLTEIPQDALDKFEAYLALLLKWNSRINLTAIREPEGIIRRHFTECIQGAQALPVVAGATLLDFGSGAGFPGIPIAICRPEIHVTLAESQRKKAAFLREAIRVLELKAEVFDGRVEEMPSEQRFSFVALRAVDKMVDATALAIQRLAPEGWIVIFSTKEAGARLEAAHPELAWSTGLSMTGMSRGEILMGQRRG